MPKRETLLGKTTDQQLAAIDMAIVQAIATRTIVEVETIQGVWIIGCAAMLEAISLLSPTGEGQSFPMQDVVDRKAVKEIFDAMCSYAIECNARRQTDALLESGKVTSGEIEKKAAALFNDICRQSREEAAVRALQGSMPDTERKPCRRCGVFVLKSEVCICGANAAQRNAMPADNFRADMGMLDSTIINGSEFILQIPVGEVIREGYVMESPGEDPKCGPILVVTFESGKQGFARRPSIGIIWIVVPRLTRAVQELYWDNKIADARRRRVDDAACKAKKAAEKRMEQHSIALAGAIDRSGPDLRSPLPPRINFGTEAHLPMPERTRSVT